LVSGGKGTGGSSLGKGAVMWGGDAVWRGRTRLSLKVHEKKTERGGRPGRREGLLQLSANRISEAGLLRKKRRAQQLIIREDRRLSRPRKRLRRLAQNMGFLLILFLRIVN